MESQLKLRTCILYLTTISYTMVAQEPYQRAKGPMQNRDVGGLKKRAYETICLGM